jgi:hypothetical protein
VLHLVNTSPGSETRLLNPGGPYHFTVTSDNDSRIALGTASVAVGSSNLRFHPDNGLPESDSLLVGKATAGRYSLERIQPEGALVPASVVGQVLTLTRSDAAANPKGIYEITAPLARDASMMAHVRFRIGAWTPFSPDWLWKAGNPNPVPVTGVVAPYFGFRYGQYNAGGFLFLRDNGATGSVILAGPLQALQTPRHVQTEVAFPWHSAAIGDVIDLWLFMSHEGFEDYQTPHVPTVEAWGAIEGSTPIVLGRFPLMAGQQFTYTEGTTAEATLFFGNAGVVGDAVAFEEWAVYPDFRQALELGQKRAAHEVTLQSDLPLLYKASSGLAGPTEQKSGRWFYSSDPQTLPPAESKEYQPGRKSAPIKAVLTKPRITGHMVYERFAPYLTRKLEGFMLEASMEAVATLHSSDSTGVGIEVGDGTYRYRILMMKRGLTTVLALAKQFGVDTLNSDFYDLGEVDYASLKLIRFTYDRLRSKMIFEVDGVLLYEMTAPGDLLLVDVDGRSPGRVRVGHIQDVLTEATCGVGLLSLVHQYKAFEALDGELPTHFPYLAATWEPGTGISSAVPGLTITKSDVSTVGTKATFLLTHEFDDHLGAFLEFRASVTTYADSHGTLFVHGDTTGAGIDIAFGGPALSLRFMDAGLGGRIVAVLGGDATLDDFLTQTEVGKLRSFSSDWGVPATYRVHYVPFQKIEIWVDSVVGVPVLTIPWVDGFGLPESNDLTTGIRFGHFDEETRSTTSWEFVRYGASQGYDVGVLQTVPDTTAGFDGKATYLLTCGDSA